MIESLAIPFLLIIAGYIIGSIRIIEQGDEALVQRFGQYKRTLKPGLNLVIPLIDTVLVETIREQVLDIEPQKTFTKDNVPLQVDAVVFWQILDLRRAYYAVEDLEEALKQIVVTSLRNEIGQLTLEQAFSSAAEINRALLSELDRKTEDWGVRVKNVAVQEFQISDELRASLERERSARSDKQATLTRTEATVKSITDLAQALQGQGNAEEVLRYLVAKDYVNASLELGKSDNSKIIFMDPRALNEAITDLLQQQGNNQDRPSDDSP